MIVLIVLGYSVTCIPYIVQRLEYDSDVFHYALFPHIRYVYTLLYLNTIVDIAVYSGFDSQFQTYMSPFLPCRWRGNKSSHMHGNQLRMTQVGGSGRTERTAIVEQGLTENGSYDNTALVT